MVRRLKGLNALLVSKGWPSISPWWMETIERFYASGKKELVIRAGRRAGKSSTLCRVAVVEALWGLHAVPPGDIGWIAIVSVNREEANQRLRTIASILDAIGIKYRKVTDGFELEGRRTGFKVFAATISGVSGFTAISVIGDELSKWKDADTGKNPAKEVIGSIKPTVATQREARVFWSSSPMGLDDSHAKMFDEGDTEFKLTASAPTWVANPTITEEYSHSLESDLRTWRREYAAIPQGAEMGAFEPDAIEYAFRDLSGAWQAGVPIISMDPAGRGSDKFVFCAAQWNRFEPTEEDKWLSDPILAPDGTVAAWVRRIDVEGNFVWNDNFLQMEPVIEFYGFTEFDSAFRQKLTADGVAQQIGRFAKRVGGKKVISDQYEAFGLESLIRKQHLQYEMYNWSGTTKAQSVGRVRSWLNSGRVILEKNDTLKREMLAYVEKITANGISYGGDAPKGGHFDHLSCLLTTAMADLAGAIQGGPTKKDRRRQAKGPGDFGNAR